MIQQANKCPYEPEDYDIFRNVFRDEITSLDSNTKAKVVNNVDNWLSSICLDCEKREDCKTIQIVKEIITDVGGLL